MVLLWKLFAGETVPRISGLEYMKRLVEHESVRQPRAVLWVVATQSSREKLLTFLRAGQGAASHPLELSSGIPVSEEDIFVAPEYARPVADETLLEIARQNRPRHIVIAVGGGVQDKLGLYLLQRLDYRPAIHCIGAALGFLTGDQVRIPDWADKYCLGWFFRSLAQPNVFVPRFWSARKLSVADLEIQGSTAALREARKNGE